MRATPGNCSLVRSCNPGDNSRSTGSCQLLRGAGNHLVFFSEHHFLEKNQVSQRGNILKSLTLELREPERVSLNPKKR